MNSTSTTNFRDLPEAKFAVTSKQTSARQRHPSGQVQLPKTGRQVGLHVACLMQQDIENAEPEEIYPATTKETGNRIAHPGQEHLSKHRVFRSSPLRSTANIVMGSYISNTRQTAEQISAQQQHTGDNSYLKESSHRILQHRVPPPSKKITDAQSWRLHDFPEGCDEKSGPRLTLRQIREKQTEPEKLTEHTSILYEQQIGHIPRQTSHSSNTTLTLYQQERLGRLRQIQQYAAFYLQGARRFLLRQNETSVTSIRIPSEQNTEIRQQTTSARPKQNRNPPLKHLSSCRGKIKRNVGCWIGNSGGACAGRLGFNPLTGIMGRRTHCLSCKRYKAYKSNIAKFRFACKHL